MIELTVNNKHHALDVDPNMPLLWALRDMLGLKGTKYGCGVGLCGSCTVLIGGQANHACMVPVGKLGERRVTTIEGLAERQHPLLGAWIDEQVPQCGYCQPGQITAAAALLAQHPKPSDAEIAAAMSGVLCRCGTYPRIQRAIRRVVRGEATSALTTRSAIVSEPEPQSLALDEWTRLAPDGTATLTVNHSEMGQGALTGLVMLIAEELEIDLARVRIVFAPADKRYRNPMFDEQTTGGSTSIRGEWERLRTAGARARVRLIRAAAGIWRVKPDECRAEHGVVIHTPTGLRLNYGELISKAAACRAPRRIALKQPAAFRVLGISQPRLEIPSMVTGRAVYGADVTLPEMLVASVARCPVFGGQAIAFNANAAKDVSGVRGIIKIERGVAVLADNAWAALGGRERLEVTWDLGANADLDGARLHQRLIEGADKRTKVAQKKGNPERAFAQAARIIEASYQTAYLAHATLEPTNCVAHATEKRCDVWVGTQSQEGAQSIAAQVSGLHKHNVHIHSLLLGGGFGRRLESDMVAEAVELSQRSGAPVQVLFTRADDLQHDFYRPAHYTLVKAALDEGGMPTAWWQRAVGPSVAVDMIDVPYAIPNLREEHAVIESPVPTGAWRSVGAGQNAFVVESFIDELAHAVKADPLEYRCALLAHAPRHRAVLELAAEKADWSSPPAAGQARGIASYYSFGSWVAEVAEISIGDDQVIRVHRVVCAIDCGQTVNPDAVRAQLEGSIAMGLSAALKEQVRIEHGRVMQAAFDDYPILTFAEMPAVEVYIVPRTEAPGGVGEPGVPPIAPAVANAVFAATGTRVRNLPLAL